MNTFQETESGKEALKPVDSAIKAALRWLDAVQEEDGFWIGYLESNSCMEAQWVLAMHFLGTDRDPKYEGVIRCILREQRPDGSWEVYYDAPYGDINTTVECYAALRAAGMDPESPPLKRARQWIFEHGGLKRTRVFTRYWLALIGEWPWEHTPELPPEIIFLPPWAPFNIYRFSSWARATMVPIALLCAGRPRRPLSPDRRLDELFPEGRDRFDYRLPGKKGRLSWEGLFLTADWLLNRYCGMPFHPFRNLARTKCIEWIIRHQDADGIWGGIQPPTIYSLMALHHEGYRLDHPVLARCFHALDTHWSHEVDGCIYIHASESPVWDTLLSVMAQLDCGLEPGGSDSMYRAIHWLMDRFVEAPGDWQVYVRGVQTGAWAFERANTWYPDVDDTAVALTVLARIRRFMKDSSAIDRAMSIATGWIEAMQCSNGGWAAFDRDNDSRLVTRIPFCDFGEALDPPSVDVTAHVLEAFGLMGRGMDDPVVARAIQYVKNEQEPEGSWFGRWGVNHIYGTAAVLPALEAVGEDMSSQYCIRAGDWIAAHQNTDGGWGESCGSYMDDSLRGKGESTASQTGWALMALLALKADKYRKAVDEGVRWLLDRQKKDGTWDEPQYTGTGFPGYGIGKRTNLEKAAEELDQGAELARGFMINYNMYRHYFPLMALGRARKWLWR